MPTRLRIGCDLVFLPRFEQTIKSGGKELLQRLFTEHELAYADRLERLAGIFAIKESMIKALGKAPQTWHDMEVYHEHGKPFVRCTMQASIMHIDVSVTHDGDYAFACVVLVLPKDNCIE